MWVCRMLFTGELDEVFRLPAVRTRRPEGRSISPSPHARNVGSPHAATPTSGLSGSPRMLSPGKFVLKKALEPQQRDMAGSPSFRRADAGETSWSDQGGEPSSGSFFNNSPLCPGTPTRQHYPQTAPSTPLQQPDVKKCLPMSEPRSVLDLTISPLQHQLPTIRATLPRRFRESFLDHNVVSTSPRVLNFESCGSPSGLYPSLAKTTTWAPDLGYPASITTQKVEGDELVASQSFNSSLDEWEAATTTSTQHNLRAKQWMASLMEDLQTGDDSTQETEECTTPFTPGVDSCSPHFLAFQRGYGSPCPSDYTGDDNPGCSGLEYLQVESPGDTPRGGGDGDGENSPAVVGHELVTLLIACAEAVSTQSLSLVNHLLQKLGELASPEGTAMQRVAAYFTEGLACRVAHLWPHIYQPLPIDSSLNEEELQTAFHLLNHVVPYTKFAHFTANDIILQAFDGADRVHVIDFDVKQGLQWPALFQSLAVRECGPPSHIRITGMTLDLHCMKSVCLSSV